MDTSERIRLANRKRIIEFFVWGLWFIILVVALIVGTATKKSIDNLVVPNLSDSEKFDVKKLIILSGDSFDITIKNDESTRILGKLSVIATENSKSNVLRLLNHSTNPKVALYEKQPDGRWAIDLFFTNDGKELNLSDWLISNNLVYK